MGTFRSKSHDPVKAIIISTMQMFWFLVCFKHPNKTRSIIGIIFRNLSAYLCAVFMSSSKTIFREILICKNLSLSIESAIIATLHSLSHTYVSGATTLRKSYNVCPTKQLVHTKKVQGILFLHGCSIGKFLLLCPLDGYVCLMSSIRLSFNK